MTSVVSANSDMRDEMRSVVRDHLASEVDHFDFDYQPL
jgi:hypothetical protein